MQYVNSNYILHIPARQQASAKAASKHWKFEKVPGNLTLLRRLLNGDWDGEDFLVIPPCATLSADHSEQIITANRP